MTGLPPIYGRWADGFNAITDQMVNFSSNEVNNSGMSLNVENIDRIKGSTAEYVAKAPQVLEYITQYITR